MTGKWEKSVFEIRQETGKIQCVAEQYSTMIFKSNLKYLKK